MDRHLTLSAGQRERCQTHSGTGTKQINAVTHTQPTHTHNTQVDCSFCQDRRLITAVHCTNLGEENLVNW